MLVMTYGAIHVRSPVRRIVRVFRFHVGRLVRELGWIMAGDAFIHGHGLRFLGVSVAAHAGHPCKLMYVAQGYFAGKRHVSFLMTALAGFPVSRLRIGMAIRNHLLFPMASAAISGLRVRHRFRRCCHELHCRE